MAMVNGVLVDDSSIEDAEDNLSEAKIDVDDISNEPDDTDEGVLVEESDEGGDPVNSKKKVQGKEDNDKYASARRESEAKVKALEEKNNAFAKKFGYASFEAMEKAQDEADKETKQQEFMEKYGVDADTAKAMYEDMKKDDPEYQSAKQISIEKKYSTAISELHEDFPDLKDIVKTIEDTEHLPNVELIKKYIAKGNTLAEAYFLANKKDIMAGKSEAMKQQALNSINSKNHLKGTGNQNVKVSDVKVPAETMAYYKQWFPTWTDKQIRDDYSKQ